MNTTRCRANIFPTRYWHLPGARFIYLVHDMWINPEWYDLLTVNSSHGELITCDEFTFSPKSDLVTVNSSQRLSYGTVNSPHGDHQTVNLSQWTCHRVKWTRHTVNSSHGDLATLETRWPSHTELVTVVTRTVTTFTAPIYSPTTPSATCLLVSIKV